MSEQQGAYTHGTLPGIKELFEQLPLKIEKINRIFEIKMKNLTNGHLLQKMNIAIKHNMDTKPMAPSTAALISTLFIECENNHRIIGELLEEIERLRLLQ